MIRHARDGAGQPEPGARRTHRAQGRPLRPGRASARSPRRAWRCCRRRSPPVKREQPNLRISLRDRDQPGADRAAGAGQARHPGRAPVRASTTSRNLRYEALIEEPVCALVRPGHPLLGMTRPRPARPGVRGLDRAARGQRAAPPLRPDVPGGRPGAADQRDRDRGAAVHHAHAAAERHGGGARDRRGALLRGARHRAPCCRSTCPATWTPSASSRAPTGCCRRRPR